MRICNPHLLLIIFLAFTSELVAQGNSSFCSNTALVPVFKQDFGTGSSSTATTTAPAGSTTYNFGGVGSDGNYIVTPFIENANKNDWTKGSDHTGNPNGNMFLVNAGGGRSIFLQQEVSGLCPGSSYSFTAWLANVNTWSTKGVCGAGLVYPKITFNIKDLSNNLLATYTTDTLPLSPVNGPAKWIKYGFQFSLPDSITSLRLEIVDFWGGGAACGNDVALDDIIFEACVPQITVSLNGNSDVCVGDSGKLQTTLTNSPYINPAYLWQKSNDGGTTWDDLTVTPNDSSAYRFNNVIPGNSGLYRVLVAPTAANIFNAYCSAISNTVFFSVNNLPTLQPSTNAPLCAGKTLLLSANPNGGSGIYNNFNWTGPTNFIASTASASRTNITTNDTGSYAITVTDSKGCKATSTLFIAVDSSFVKADAGADTTICVATTFQLYANMPTNSTGIWSTISGPSSLQFSSTSNPLSSIQNLVEGIYLLSWTVTSICNTSTDTIILKVLKKPIANLSITPLNTCLPLQVKFEPTISGENAIGNIFWGDGNDSLLTDTVAFTHTYFGNTNTIINPYLVAQNSCGTDTAFEFINAIANNLFIDNNLKDTSVCSLPFQLSIQNNTTGANTIHWNWGDGTSSNNSSSIVSHNYTKQGVYSVTNTLSNICGDTMITRKIKLNINPKALIHSVPNNSCIGDTIQLNTVFDSLLHYKWFINNQLVDSTPTIQYVFSQAGNYSPLLQVRNTANGFSCVDSTSININIVAEKPGNASITPTNGSCVPFTLKLLNTSLPAASVIWQLGNDSTVQGNTASYTYTQGGDYLVKMRATTTGGCNYTDSTLVSIRSPQGNIIIPNNKACGPKGLINFKPAVKFTDRIAWDFGDGKLLETAVQDQSHQYNKPGIYYPSAILISNTGCRVAIQLDSIIIENVQAAFNTKTIYECGKTVFNFSDSSYSSSNISKIIWNTDNRFVGNDKSATSTFAITGTHTTQLIATGKYGCTDTVIGTYNVSIYDLPKVNINAINEACLNSLMELKSEISSIDSVILRLWNLGNGKTVTDSAVRILYYDQGQYTVRLTVATVNKCYDSALKKITIHPVPEVKVAGPEKICIGETVELKATGAGANNFVWKDQQDNIICNNCLTIKVKPLRSTQYSVIGYNAFGCTQVNSTRINVVDKPKINIIPEDTICLGESTRLWVSGAANYQWLPAAGLNNYNSATPTATPSTTTSYKVVGRDMNNCFTDTATVRVIVGNPTPITVGRDSNFVAGSKIQLRATPSGTDIIRWKWSGGSDLSCVNCPNPVARVVFDECISCAAANRYGCITNDTVCFKTFCPTTEVFIPNAFTPDGDGVNDQFFVQAKGVRTIKSLRLFNRWGELVFEKTNFLPNDATSGWNGRIRGVTANPDVYVYICEVICEKGGTQLYKGNVAIIK